MYTLSYNNKFNLRQRHQLYLVLEEWLHVSTLTGSSSDIFLNQVNETLCTLLGSQLTFTNSRASFLTMNSTGNNIIKTSIV